MQVPYRVELPLSTSWVFQMFDFVRPVLLEEAKGIYKWQIMH